MATARQANDARVLAGYNTFVARAGETFGPYASSENGEAIMKRAIETFGLNLPSSDYFEIAFKQLLAEGALTTNPDYVAPSVRAEIEKLPAGESMRRYRRDPEFRKTYDLLAKEDLAAGRFVDSDPYRNLTAAAYQAIPPTQRAELYARNLFFQRAVERLVAQREI